MSMRKARQHKARRTHPGVMLLDDFLPEYGRIILRKYPTVGPPVLMER